MQDLILIVFISLSKLQIILFLINHGNQILEDDGSFKTIEYDGYLDRSRLGPGFLQKDLLYSKRFFSDFQRVLLKNKKEGSNSLAINYQFTHEYKKMEFNDEMNSEIFGEVYDEDQTII